MTCETERRAESSNQRFMFRFGWSGESVQFMFMAYNV